MLDDEQIELTALPCAHRHRLVRTEVRSIFIFILIRRLIRYLQRRRGRG